MEKEDENWLLSSISKAWDKVRTDAGKGYIWTERDIISSFYRHLVPLVEKRNSDPSNTLGNLGVQTEVQIVGQYSKDKRSIDLAIVESSTSKARRYLPSIPRPSRIIVHFEFKFAWGYSIAYVRTQLVEDIEKIMTGNKNWLMYRTQTPATTDFVVLGLVASNWDSHIHILHPNGETRKSKSGKSVPLLEDLRAGLRYFELHGQLSTKEIFGTQNRWGFFEIDRTGQRREIS